jgi:2-deoxy-D-gluconate 3-dehydrogenase
MGTCVNAISPGAPDSGQAGARSPEYLQSKGAVRSIHRIHTPDDLVGAMVFLCSPPSDFVTGQHIVVDGGGVFQ